MPLNISTVENRRLHPQHVNEHNGDLTTVSKLPALIIVEVDSGIELVFGPKCLLRGTEMLNKNFSVGPRTFVDPTA
jgi:hypothetical protein